MSKLDTVIDFYEEQLTDLSLEVVGDGFVTFVNKDDESKPVSISSKRLCLPTKALLKEAIWDERVVFHPLAEQFMTDLSPIMNALKNYISVSLTMKMSVMAVAIAEFIAEPERHKGASSAVGKLLKALGDIDSKTVTAIKSIIRKIGDVPESRLVNILLRNGDDEKSLRSCIITHPIVDALELAAQNGDVEFMGMKTLRKMDLAPLALLFRYVVGEKIVVSSNDRTAPYYEALLLAWKESAEHLNDIHGVFKTKVPAIKEIGPYELKWVEQLDNFADFANKHHGVAPPLPGNRPVATAPVAKTSRRGDAAMDALTARAEKMYATDTIAVEDTVIPERVRPTAGDVEEPPVRRSGRLSERDDRPSQRSIYDYSNPAPTRGRGDDRGSRYRSDRDDRRDSYRGRDDRDARSNRGSYRDEPKRRSSINDW